MTTSSGSDQQHEIFILVDVFGIINLATESDVDDVVRSAR